MAGLGVKPGKRNTIADVSGLSVGQAADDALKSGVTVVVGDEPMVAGVHVMGGAPGTRETDLLRPDATVEGVDALVLSGGSAFGLAAATGVSDALASDGRGFPAAGHVVPIVPAAILFDLANGGNKNWTENPYPALGREAYAARGHDVGLGSAGAGTGATVADLKGGQGTASAVLPSGAVVGAVVAVNALGQVTVGDGPQFWAAPWEQASEFGGLGVATVAPDTVSTKDSDTGNTTIAVVATDLALTKAEARRVAVAAHDGMARAIVPSHTPMDGDLIFACSTGQRAPEPQDIAMLGHAAATCLARAIARGVYHASPADADPFPTWSEKFA
ncbi:MAG: P1 family peptidase [Boseongicola sp.]